MFAKLVLAAMLAGLALSAPVNNRCATTNDVLQNMNEWTPKARKYDVGIKSRNCVKAMMLNFIKTCHTLSELGGFMGSVTPGCVDKYRFARR